MATEIRDTIIWIIIASGLLALAFWLLQYVPEPFRRPARIILIVIAVVCVVYLVFALIMAFAPPFPGRG